MLVDIAERVPNGRRGVVSSTATYLCLVCPWDVCQAPWPDLRTLSSLEEHSSRVDHEVQARKWHRN